MFSYCQIHVSLQAIIFYVIVFLCSQGKIHIYIRECLLNNRSSFLSEAICIASWSSVLYFLLGYMQNNDVPMHIANCCGGHYFTGCLDEVRINALKLVLPPIMSCRTKGSDVNRG